MTKQEYEANPRAHWEIRMKGGNKEISRSSSPLWVSNILPDIIINKGRTWCVDLGCGEGRYIGLTAEYFTHVIGVDFSASSIEQARKNAVGKKNIFFNHTSLDNMKDILDNSVDFAYSVAVFMHMTNKTRNAALEELHRILKLDGRAVLLEITSMEQGAFDCPNLTPLEWENMIISAEFIIDEITGKEHEGNFIKYKLHKER